MQAIKQLGFALLFCPALLARADSSASTPAATNSLAAEIRHEEGPGLLPVNRAYMQVGTNKYAFMVPAGLHIDPAGEGEMVLRNDDYSCFVSFRLRGALPPAASELSPNQAQEMLLGEQPNGKISQEFSLSANNRSGPAFDLQWLGPGGLVKCGRFAFIPCHDQVLEFAAICTKENFAAGQRMLQTVLLTFRASDADGKLNIPPASDKL